MQLKNINKTRYRRHLNYVIAAFVISFALLALLFGQLLITLFSEPRADNFIFNATGVGLALVLVLSLINLCKQHPFMYEVYYVWRLKQQINQIYRQLKHVKHAAFAEHNRDALVCLCFYYQACHQLYQLDDNTITLSSLNKEEQHLLDFIVRHHLTVDVTDFKPQLVNFR
ncbi:DUF3087 family protein [Thalassotalea maritima]|uniref:DUF3087 family protein n=1 Tax=Thalassotalea maritima TaxID=3242416 RepID=UPI003529B549